MGINRLSQRQLVERMEDDGDDLATWQWKPRKLVSAPFQGYVHTKSFVTLLRRPPALQPDLPWLPPGLRLLEQQRVPPKQF
jgi:hypothetical protein